MNGEPIIELENLSRWYGEILGVNRINATIPPGITGLLGPNGAGKSTSIKMLTGILTPTEGTVRVGGRDPHRQRRENAARMGVVFGQRTHLWWDLPVIESFELLRHMYRVPLERYRENLDTFNDLLELSSFFPTPVRQLSLGQRMRADIAAALLHDPEVLFLDEPTIGLDVISKGAAQSWQMENRGKTMVADKFDFGFAVDWMRKDLEICLSEADRNGAVLPVTALIDQFYKEVQKMGGSRWDTSSLLARLAR